jgi:putative ABC transport system permease protein
MESILRDLKHALRMFRQSPGFVLAAVAALALGIGANTAIFSVINTVLLKPLPYPNSGRIVQFLLNRPGESVPIAGASVTKFHLWREQTKVFQDVAAYNYGGVWMNLTGGTYPEQVHGIHVTADYFRLFGATLAQGRTFTPDEDRPNGARVVVLSNGLWRRRYGSDPSIVGKTISLSSEPYTVIGLLGPEFRTEWDSSPDVWIPFRFDPNSNDQAHYFFAAARLKPGVTVEAANAQLQGAVEEFRRRYPGVMGLLGPRDGFSVQPLEEGIVSDVRPSLLILAGAVSLVLLIACANVANLLLARATSRRREIAVRTALGADRSRIVRQLLTESVSLALAGGAAGLVLGMIGVRALLALNPGDIPRIGENGAAVAADWRVLAFTICVSLTTGVVFGLIPALGSSQTDLSVAIKESGGRSGSGLRENKARSLLVVSEIALAVILLAGAALLIRSFVALRAIDPGFDAHNVLTLRMSLEGSRFNNTAAVTQLGVEAARRIDALPGVVACATTYSLPLESGHGLPFDVVGKPLPNGPQRVRWVSVSPEYFDVFRIPNSRGRVFDDRDSRGAAPVVLINQAMARQFWPDRNPLDDQILIGKGYGPEFVDPPRQIIGIVGDVRDEALNHAPNPMLYVPEAQVPDGMSALFARIDPLIWVVRTRVAPASLQAAIEKEAREASGGLPAAHVLSMEAIRKQSTARADFNMTLLTIFGASALLLAAIGIYGLMAYSVEQRTQEIGIRMALGARRGDVRSMVVRQGMRLALIGVAIGVAAAFGLTRLIASFLFGVKSTDPIVFVTVPLLLSAVAFFAVWLPARRASAVDPIEALRYQ